MDVKVSFRKYRMMKHVRMYASHFLLYTGREATAQMRDRDPGTGEIRDIAFRGIIRKVGGVMR